MAKYAADLAYIADGQCNDQPVAVIVVTDPRRAAAVGAPAARIASAPAAPWGRRLLNFTIGLLTFAAQVACVILVIVLIARFAIR